MKYSSIWTARTFSAFAALTLALSVAACGDDDDNDDDDSDVVVTVDGGDVNSDAATDTMPDMSDTMSDTMPDMTDTTVVPDADVTIDIVEDADADTDADIDIDADADGSGDASETPTCASYCATIQASCTGDEAQYDSEEACNTYCETWASLPLGTVEDTAGNTVGCRTYHAGVAGATMPGLHCPHAGPSGANTCGTWCDNYCQLAMTNCTGDLAIYDDMDACTTACDGLNDTAEPGATGGDSVQCRIYHLGVAGSDIDGGSATTHCPHGGVDGGGVCTDG